jgi:outer membrane receptor protein involved in Fe transport
MKNRARIAVAFGLAVLFSTLAGLAPAAEAPSAPRPPQEQAQASQTPRPEEEEDRTKLFQLTPVTIEVVEYLRDKEIPNMNVVKTELFPLTMGVTLDTALERQPGVDIQRLQEVGTAVDDDSIKIRGMGSRRLKVLRNGRELNTSGVAGGYFIDWTMIPLADADRVEVIKGIADPRYGNILGGVINLVPRGLKTERPDTRIQAAAASYNTQSVNLYHGFKPGALEYSLTAGLSRSRGYLWNGTVDLASAGLHLGYDFPFQGRLTAELGFTSLRKGFAVANRAAKDPGQALYSTALDPDYPASDGEIMYGGMGAYAQPGSWWRKKRWTLDLGYQQALGDWGLVDVRYWQNHGDREAYNERADLGRVFHKLFYDDRSRGFSASYQHFFGGQTLILGLDYSRLSDDGDRNYADDFRAPFRNGSYVSARDIELYALDEIRLWSGRLSIVPGVRILFYDGIAGPAGILEGIPDLRLSGWAPSLKVSYQYSPGGLVYLSAARGLRLPTPPEHFWHYDYDSGVDTSGLPFRAEDGLLLQAGWTLSPASGIRVEVAPYYYSIRHYIQFDLINFVAYNIDRATVGGVEVEVAQPLGGGWSAFANYTLQLSRTADDPFVALFVDPRDRGFDKIPGLPVHKGNLGLQFRTKAGASAAVFAQAVSRQKVIYNNNELYDTALRVWTQAGFVRFDLEGRLPLGPSLELAAFVRNIFNASYQERFGYPAAGRNAGLSLRATL